MTATPVIFPLEGRKIWVAGHRGMVGSAVVRALAGRGIGTVTPDQRIDLRRQADVEDWMSAARPDVVVLAAAKVGGILANSSEPVDFLYDNLMIASNVMAAAANIGVAKLAFLGSSCIYPKFAEQPIREDALLTGTLEPTNEAYAIAKIAGLKLAEAYRKQEGCDFISLMPTNLYGPNDNFDLAGSHVLPALIRKIHEAKTLNSPNVTLWGTGTPRREFLHVDNLADATLFLLERYSQAGHINVGTGTDVTITELATTLADVIGWRGEFNYDASKPDGTPRKRLDVSRLTALGWSPSISLRDGLCSTYRWFLEQDGHIRGAA
jgi:GDP-L-fucose synthase